MLTYSLMLCRVWRSCFRWEVHCFLLSHLLKLGQDYLLSCCNKHLMMCMSLCLSTEHRWLTLNLPTCIVKCCYELCVLGDRTERDLQSWKSQLSHRLISLIWKHAWWGMQVQINCHRNLKVTWEHSIVILIWLGIQRLTVQIM